LANGFYKGAKLASLWMSVFKELSLNVSATVLRVLQSIESSPRLKPCLKPYWAVGLSIFKFTWAILNENRGSNPL
jgi:hypothetical protein